MNYRRVIPCLDVKHGRLVKGVNFVRLKDVGDPADNPTAIRQMKEHLASHGIPVRL